MIMQLKKVESMEDGRLQ